VSERKGNFGLRRIGEEKTKRPGEQSQTKAKNQQSKKKHRKSRQPRRAAPNKKQQHRIVKYPGTVSGVVNIINFPDRA